jgi:hypothetical protein
MSAGEPLDLVRPVADKRAFLALMNERWGSHRMMIGLNTYDCSEIDLLGLFDESGATLALASWTSEGETALLCALISLAPGTSAAADLLGAVKVAARTSGALKLRAMVTNDNIPGLIFYQKQGFRFSALYVEAIEIYRSLIPTIITTGHLDIPVRDALELEITL